MKVKARYRHSFVPPAKIGVMDRQTLLPPLPARLKETIRPFNELVAIGM
jgi:hypothetical protein